MDSGLREMLKIRQEPRWVCNPHIITVLCGDLNFSAVFASNKKGQSSYSDSLIKEDKGFTRYPPPFFSMVIHLISDSLRNNKFMIFAKAQQFHESGFYTASYYGFDTFRSTV